MAKWISVEDRLPDKYTPVLCCRKYVGVADILEYGLVHGKMCFYYFDEDGFVVEATNPDVTHWMPLPEPPKEG